MCSCCGRRTHTFNILPTTSRDFDTRSPISSSTFNTSNAFCACITVGSFISIAHLYKNFSFVEDAILPFDETAGFSSKLFLSSTASSVECATKLLISQCCYFALIASKCRNLVSLACPVFICCKMRDIVFCFKVFLLDIQDVNRWRPSEWKG